MQMTMERLMLEDMKNIKKEEVSISSYSVNTSSMSVEQPLTSIKEIIYFAFNSINIEPNHYTVLDKIAGIIKDSPEIKVEITGHTDSIGSASYNQQLSLKRAQNVMDYFVKTKSLSSEVFLIGYGCKKPLVSETDEESKRKNRRVEILLERQK